MRISLNEIKKLVPAAAKVDTDELIKLIGSRLVEVEEKIDLSTKYNNIYVVRVIACEPIPETHLHLCQIETPEKVQVVCGAPNVREGMHAVWIAPGAIVPQTFGTDEEFKIDSRKLRGYESHGMLAGLDELDLGDDHSGIIEISPEIKPGTPFAEAFDLNDIILDIENKSLTHRPDTFGLIGFAREVAGILGADFEDANLDSTARHLATTGASKRSEPRNDGREQASRAGDIQIGIDDATLCPRYSCSVIEISDPLSDDPYLTAMDIFLAKAGMRGISKIVDVTNYLMLMTGQPLHAFDYDKFIKVGGIASPKIIVRAAKNGEELKLLDGKTIKCTENDILITSNDVPVALAGAMGGASTEIDQSTKKVILESATFSLYNLRRTQMSHGIFSEAITRFTKGQPAAQTLPVLEQACAMLGGNVVETADAYPSPAEPSVVKITTEEINSLLGTNYSEKLIIDTLEHVGFVIEASKSTPLDAKNPSCLRITTPSWRTDIHIKEDIIEEVGRLLGYDNIALSFPTRPFIGAKKDALLELKSSLRNILSDRLAAHEVLTYSFVSQNLQETVGEDPADSYEIVNSISPELQRFRQSLIPSLLEKTRDNLKAGFKNFSLYEINQVTKKSRGLDVDGVPKLSTHLAFVTTGDFYAAKANLVALLNRLGFSAPNLQSFDGTYPYFEPLHSASEKDLGLCLGEIKSPVLKRLKIDQTISAFEIDLDVLLEKLPASSAHVSKISRFPSVERDLTLKVAKNHDFAAAEAAISDSLKKSPDLIFDLTPTSVYQPADETNFRNLSFHLRFASTNKTLENSEISAIMERISKSVMQAVGAEII